MDLLVQQNQTTSDSLDGGNRQERSSLGQVGIVSTSSTALQEVAQLLTGAEVRVASAICVESQDSDAGTGGPVLLDGLRACQDDPATEVIVLIARASPPKVANQALARVRESAKPTVACLLGGDQRLIWRAGAIPSARLDEAAMRAAAWVRGWDQALISSHLADQDEQWAALADDLQSRIHPPSRQFCALFSSRFFCLEAQLMLAEVGSQGANVHCLTLDLERQQRLQAALADPGVAVVLLDMLLGRDPGPDPVDVLADLLGKMRQAPLVIAHVSADPAAPQGLAAREARLSDAGAILAPSNAAAARLAGMVMARLHRR
jgi:FdrA protein